jgi:hypothetical protein
MTVPDDSYRQDLEQRLGCIIRSPDLEPGEAHQLFRRIITSTPCRLRGG